jgi:hypothetical protein
MTLTRTLRTGATSGVKSIGHVRPYNLAEGMALVGRELYVLPEDGPSRLFHFRLDADARQYAASTTGGKRLALRMDGANEISARVFLPVEVSTGSLLLQVSGGFREARTRSSTKASGPVTDPTRGVKR